MSTSGGTPETATIYVTVIIDLTPTRTRTGPSRLLAVVEGRSKQAFKSWLEAQTKAFRDRVEIVAMDGFTGYKTAAVETIDTVTTVMDPFHVVALVGDKLDRCRQRVQQETLGHRGRSGDPLYGIRRVARTRAGLLTTKQQHRLAKVFADERHVAFEVTWSLYQSVIEAYQADQPAEGKKIMTRLITSIQSGAPAGLEELRSLGQTMKRRCDDILAFFDHPSTSNGPTEAVNWVTRTPPRHSQRLPQHRQLHHPVPPRRGRVQTPDPLTSVKSPLCRVGEVGDEVSVVRLIVEQRTKYRSAAHDHLFAARGQSGLVLQVA